jgi:hypothetical protein
MSRVRLESVAQVPVTGETLPTGQAPHLTVQVVAVQVEAETLVAMVLMGL